MTEPSNKQTVSRPYGPGTNTGHGHVWERPDGMKARCGGPGICLECAKDLARVSNQLEKEVMSVNAAIPQTEQQYPVLSSLTKEQVKELREKPLLSPRIAHGLSGRERHKRRVEELEAAIRKHRDQRGDDRCWLDDEELYKVLPEGYTPPARDMKVELCNCLKFIATRHNPNTSYVSPDREIEQLRDRLERIKGGYGDDFPAFYNDIITALKAAKAGDMTAVDAFLERFQRACELMHTLFDRVV